MKIKLLLDARKILDGGVGSYCQNIISAVRENKNIALTLLLNPEQQIAIRDRLPNLIDQLPIVLDPARVFSFDEYFNLSRRVRFADYDLYHTPFFTLPRGVQIPSIITLHDLIQITHPEHWYYPMVAKLMIRDAISRSHGVLTVSQFSANLILKYFPKAESRKLAVIPNALPLSNNKNFPEDSLQLPKKFFLAVFSNSKPHKGMLRLVRIFSALVSEGRISKDVFLVLAGLGTNDLADFECPQILNLKTQSAEALKELYRRAHALIVASEVEGFCLPIIEAHAFGTPVIARPLLVLQELSTADDCLAKDLSDLALSEEIANFASRPQAKYSFNLENYALSSLSARLASYYQRILTSKDCC